MFKPAPFRNNTSGNPSANRHVGAWLLAVNQFSYVTGTTQERTPGVIEPWLAPTAPLRTDNEQAQQCGPLPSGVSFLRGDF